jgi:hypothetical protein
MTSVDQIVATVLYEGYVLWPYRRSARKNQQRWTFGGVYPRGFCEASGSLDPWQMQTQALVEAERADICLEVRVRFLQVVERHAARRDPDGQLAFVDELRTDAERYLSWDEAVERQVTLSRIPLGDRRYVEIDIPAGEQQEPLPGGALVRRWRQLRGTVEVRTDLLHAGLYRLTVLISNTLPWQAAERDGAVRQSFVSTHTIASVEGGTFVSLMDPPDALKGFAAGCENRHTWPVLAGEEGDRHTLLSSPIILYDYPRIAPESPGDLFDASEIDQLLALNILTLTDEEKSEMRATDPRARTILERTESLTGDELLGLHGTMRELRYLRELEASVPRSVRVAGVELGAGSRVRLRPRAGRDLMDVVLAGKIAVVEAIEQDYDERLHLAVTVEDDPGRDLGQARMIGHRFFFAPDEVEPL